MNVASFFKPGDTFDYSGQITVNGAVTDMTGWAATLHIDAATSGLSGGVQQPGVTVADIAGTWVDALQGVVRFTVIDTTAWPVGPTYLLDLSLLSPTGAITTSGTIRLITDRRIGAT